MSNSSTPPIALACAVVGIFIGYSLGHQAPAPVAASAGSSMLVHFSPKGGCEQKVIETIGAARQTIDVQAYTFTSPGIAQALADAAGRGVRVRAVLDRQAAGEPGSEASFLAQHNVASWLDGQHPIAHNKVMIIDGQTTITGSFNFTRQAENANAENLLVIYGNASLAGEYEQNFETHLGHSDPYHGETLQTEHSRREREPRSVD